MIYSPLMPSSLLTDFLTNEVVLMDFVLASKNKNKLTELRRILSPLGINVISEADSGISFPEVEEDGATFEENAMIKARSACMACSMPAIADDSGLCVDALGGAPGIYSARYADEGHNDDDNNEKLLAELEDVPDSERTARYVCAVCCCFPDGRTLTVRGECEGKIGYTYRGNGGFGYDPLFMLGSLSFGELTAEQKDAVSHRGKALRDFAIQIKDYI